LFYVFIVKNREDEVASQPVEEQVDVPSFFFLDDIADVVDLHIYDKYDHDCDVNFLEKLAGCSMSENIPFQQYTERN